MRKTTTRESVHIGDVPSTAAAVATFAAASAQIRTEPEPLEELGKRVTAPIVVAPETLEELQARIETPRAPSPALAELFKPEDTEHEELLELTAPNKPTTLEEIASREYARANARADERDNETLYRGTGADPGTIVGLDAPAPDKGK